MAYLESQNYIHRDLAARNVLVDDNNRCNKRLQWNYDVPYRFRTSGHTISVHSLVVRVSVYKAGGPGLNLRGSRKDSEYTSREGTKVPVRWTAPEAVSKNSFSIKSDVWSFGVLLSEITTFCQFVPYKGIKNRNLIERLERGYRMPRPMGCPEPLYDIMLDCWSENPEDRPTFRTLQTTLTSFFDKTHYAKSTNLET
ncbi:protein tyrosine kinase src [Apostichopus japonicus]|uniref:Protein tyrosine kinase src n=1 Tax=Stichopus japonicus TaxID=307972 RepID=A0A2G8JBK1_STIJA|nr:protein tyrosine kinase src [Apostichopus japonicus]